VNRESRESLLKFAGLAGIPGLAIDKRGAWRL